MTRGIKTLLTSTTLASLLAAGSLIATPASASAGDHRDDRHDDRGRIERRDDVRADHRDVDRHDVVRIAVADPAPVANRVWIEPVYQTVTDHVWHPAVTRTECTRVWVPDEYKTIPNPFNAAASQRVLVKKGHYEDRNVEVVVTPGYYEDVARQVLVTPGQWEDCAAPDNSSSTSFHLDVHF